MQFGEKSGMFGEKFGENGEKSVLILGLWRHFSTFPTFSDFSLKPKP
jgi:hypothetical protein